MAEGAPKRLNSYMDHVPDIMETTTSEPEHEIGSRFWLVYSLLPCNAGLLCSACPAKCIHCQE